MILVNFKHDPSTASRTAKTTMNIANDLRSKMGTDEFRDYILGLIFYKYLSENVIL